MKLTLDWAFGIERYGPWSIRPGQGRQRGGGQCWYVAGPSLKTRKRCRSREEALEYLRRKGVVV